MNIRLHLLAITVALCTGSSLAKAQDDLETSGPLATLAYQDQLVACSYFFSERAHTEAGFEDNVEVRKFAVRNYLRNMHLVLVPQNELIPGTRDRAAHAVGEAAARSNAGAEVMERYCFRAVLAGTRWMSKDDRLRIEAMVEHDYVLMRPPFRRPGFR